MNANFHQSSSRSAVSGAIAMPSAPVVPLQNTLLSSRTIETLAPATGAPVSRRVTKISVFCGLSLTLMPRLVTWTSEARVLFPYVVVFGIVSPGFTAAHTIPVGFVPRAFDTSSPCDWMRSATTPNGRGVPAPAGASVKLLLPQALDRGHQLAELEGHRPLRRVPEIPRVERQQRSAAGLPHAVAVAEAGERGPVPVLDGADPRVAERLAVGGAQPGVDGDRVRARGGLGVEPGVLERQ